MQEPNLTCSTPNHMEGLYYSSNNSFHLPTQDQLDPIPETQIKPRPKLDLDSDNVVEHQHRESSESASSETVRKYVRSQGKSKSKSGKTPDREDEVHNPQVKSMLRNATFVSQSSFHKSKVKPSRLQSLQQSFKFSRVVPEDQLSASVNDSFFESLRQEEQNNQGRFRYDSRYYNIKFMIFPDDPIKIIWDLTLILSLVWITLVVPFSIAFEDQQSDTEAYMSILIECIYCADIILRFFTAYIDDQDELVVQRSLIAKNYLLGWFVIDVICIIPFDSFFTESSLVDIQKFAKLSRITKLVQIFRMARIVKLCCQKQKYSEIFQNLGSIRSNVRIMIASLITVLIVSHFLACLWYFIGIVNPTSNNWVSKFIGDEEMAERYIISFYWVIQTISTTGYGDISAVNSTEQLVACIIMIIGVIFFSVTIGSVSSLLTQLDSRNLKLKEKMDILNEVAKKYKIDHQLYIKISRVLKFGYKNNQNEYSEFLHTLPQNLRIELSLCMYQNVLLGIDLFKDKPARFTAYIGPLLTIQKVQEDDIIYNEGDYANEIYFIKQGKVQLTIKSFDYHPFFSFVQGQYFGEIDLLFGEQRKYTAIAQQNCELLTLSKSNFSKIFFSQFKEIGQEMHNQALKNKMQQLEYYKKCVEYLKRLEEQANDNSDSSPQKKPKISYLEKFKKNWAMQASQKKGFLARIIDEVNQNPHPELSLRMSRLKTVLITKGLIDQDESVHAPQSKYRSQTIIQQRSVMPESETKIQNFDRIVEDVPNEQQQVDEDVIKPSQTVPVQIPQTEPRISKHIDRFERRESLNRRNNKKSLTMLLSNEDDQIHKSNSNKNIQFFKRKGKQMYLQ